MERQIIRIPFTRIDEGKRTVYGYASTGRVDTYDTIFDPAWWPQAVIGYKDIRTISAMHLDLYGEPQMETGREPMVVGTVPMLECDDKGLWIGAEIRDAQAWDAIISGEYNGFSIAAIPYEWREETISGRWVIRFTKYHLTDITVGYPAANLDARFALIERTTATDDSSPWDWDRTDADAIVSRLGWDGLAQACLYRDPAADPKTMEAYRLPVMKLKEGTLTLYFNGVRAAMARVLGGGGQMDIAEDERQKLYRTLTGLYRKFGRESEAPEYRLETQGGNTMSTFADQVKGIIKRLSGKDPDAQAVQEITALEARLSGEQATQIETLAKTVTDLTARLEKIETPTPAAEDPAVKALKDTVSSLEGRLKSAEDALAASKQPGEGGGSGGNRSNMDSLIRGRLGIKG